LRWCHRSQGEQENASGLSVGLHLDIRTEQNEAELMTQMSRIDFA
jgi:hypothetical protein